jgi:hypothetical protein
VKGFGDGAEAVFAPGLALGGAGLGDEDGDGVGLIDSLLVEETMCGGDVFCCGEDLRLEESGVGLKLFEECGTVTECFKDAKVVGDLADAGVVVEIVAGKLGDDREADAVGGAAEHSSKGDAEALVASGEEDGVALAAEGVCFAEGARGGENFAKRAWCGNETLEAGVVAQDVEGEAAGCG